MIMTEKVKKWQQQLRSEQRQLDSELRTLQRAQDKSKSQCKALAKQGQVKDAKMLARELVRSRKQSNRLHTAKARLNSINMQLTHQLGAFLSLLVLDISLIRGNGNIATLKITGSLQKSTEIIKLSNSLIKLPELSRNMQQMSMEMTKSGLMAEMVDDTLDMALDEDDEEMEEEAEQEVENVLWEITEGKLGQAGKVANNLPAQPAAQENAEEEEAEHRRMQQQLNELLGS